MNNKELRNKIVRDINTFMKNPQTQFGDKNYFEVEDVSNFISELLKFENKINVINSLKISLRKGGIIIIEEEISYNKIKRFDIELKDVIKKATIEFSIKQRSIGRLKSIEHIHPEKPCEQYEDNKRSMGEYLKALKFILANQQILIKHMEVSKGLENSKNKVIGCESLKLVYTK